MNNKHERGNVLFYILIAVVLFGALSFAVSNMMNTGNTDSVSQETDKLNADDIMAYGQVLRRAIQPMKISNGCEETDISFETSALTGYTNGANVKCQVFNSSGGGANYLKPSTKFGDGSDWIFTGTNNVSGVGTTAPDLIAILPHIHLKVCNAINARLGLSSVGTDATVDYTKFQGTFAATQTLDDAAGNTAGCLTDAASSTFFYYQVLLAR